MVDALAAVGIVANIVQLVDIGTRVLKRLDQYQSTLAEIPEAFRHIKSELPVLLDALRQTKAAIDAGSLQDESKRALLPAMEGCSVQIKALDEVIEKVLPALSDSWARRQRKSLQSLRYDAKVEKITAVIRGYVQTLTYHAAASSKSSAGYTLPPLTPSSTVPFRRDDDFVSRDSLTKIRQICARPAARAALVGLGGVGKSQIAIEYAYQVRDDSPDTWVFWVHAGTQARFEEGYRRIAEATRMEGWDNSKADILRLVRSWLYDESNGRWAMIVDNADDSSVFLCAGSQGRGADPLDQLAEPLLDFLPQSPNGSVLITSRSHDVAYRLTGSHTCMVEVKPMDKDDGLNLLRNKLRFNGDEEIAVKLLQALDYMPLAITQAAAYIAQRAPRMTVTRYLDEIRRNDHDRAHLLKKDVGDSRRDSRASNSIIATWQISFEHIRKNMPTAARLLSLMSLFDRQGISESLLSHRYERDEDGEVDFEEDIHTLISYSLVEMSSDGNAFEMHRLVQFTTKNWLELNQELEEWKGKYIRLMDDECPEGRQENWKICQALFPHAQAAMACRPAHRSALKTWASILFKAAWYAREAGNYNAAQEMDTYALEARQGILGPEHRDTLNSSENLGLVLARQGKYEKAEEMHRQTLRIREDVFGREDPDTIDSVSNLALVLLRQGKYKEAEEMHREDLERSQKVLGPDHRDTLTSINNLGLVLERQGKYEDAEAMHRRALEVREKVLGREDSDTLSSVSNLGSALESQGKYEKAEAMHWRALEGYEKVLGQEHPDTLISLDKLGSVFQKQGKYGEAERLHRRALEGYEKRNWQEHPYALASVGNLGSVLRRQGKYEEAETMHRRDLRESEKALGPEHPDTLTSISNLGLVLESQGKYEEAQAMHWQSLEGREKVLGLEHPHTFTSVKNLARVLRAQGKNDEIEEMIGRGLEERGRAPTR